MDMKFRISAPADLWKVRSALRAELKDARVDDDDIGAVVLATQEAAKNGLRFSDAAATPVAVCAKLQGGSVVVEVRDAGNGFALAPGGLQDMPRPEVIHGRGIFLMRRLMDLTEVTCSDRGCVVRMEKRLPGRPQASAGIAVS